MKYFLILFLMTSAAISNCMDDVVKDKKVQEKRFKDVESKGAEATRHVDQFDYFIARVLADLPDPSDPNPKIYPRRSRISMQDCNSEDLITKKLAKL